MGKHHPMHASKRAVRRRARIRESRGRRAQAEEAQHHQGPAMHRTSRGTRRTARSLTTSNLAHPCHLLPTCACLTYHVACHLLVLGTPVLWQHANPAHVCVRLRDNTRMPKAGVVRRMHCFRNAATREVIGSLVSLRRQPRPDSNEPIKHLQPEQLL